MSSESRSGSDGSEPSTARSRRGSAAATRAQRSLRRRSTTRKGNASVLELALTRVSVVSCLASAEALAELDPPADGYLCWAAEDEVMLVGGPDAAGDVIGAAREELSGRDDDALVVDVSDGWSAWT